ncbi:aminotransferase-like domain-containing protein [Geminicoccus roseus]|uniref:aminotransferase-like domain-containing protein n=1 Tax=Geminicoccus roseus TaxID=404900 RepID=UPI0003F584CB|nr:PLP-dependent aminotransferase family protein [Geminicoccus roseus]
MTLTTTGFAFADLFAAGLPAAAAPWSGFPRFNFVGGHNDPGLVPAEALAEAAASALRADADKLAIYNLGQGPLGYLGLREFVAGKLARRGIAATADSVLITSGSLHGLDYVNTLLVEPGDTVLMEEFTYAGAIAKVRARGAEVAAIPLDGDGLRIDALEAKLGDLRSRGIRPKYIYTIPTIQNPTGSVLPLERRHALIELSRRFGVPIFEDECYADLTWAMEAPPALFGLAPGQVLHIGSFSKSLAPALRVAYLTAAEPALGTIVAGKSDGGTGAVDQMTVAAYFGRHFDSHVERLSSGLRDKLDTMVEAVEREFGTAVEIWRPKGGIFLWLKLPDEVDVRRLVQPAASRGVAFNPGPEWAVDAEAGRSHLRLCFALPGYDEIRQGVAELAAACFETTGIPARGANTIRS